MTLDEETYQEVWRYYNENTFHSIGQKKAIKLLKSRGFDNFEALKISQDIFERHFHVRYTFVQMLIIVASYIGVVFVLSDILPSEYKQVIQILMGAIGFIGYAIMIRLKR